MSRTQQHMGRLTALVLLIVALVATSFALVACGSSDQSAPDPNAPKISVSLKIDGTEGERGIIYDKKVEVAKESNVYDVLLASEVELSVKNSMGMGTYVAGIDGLMERSHGAQSGWLYEVNDEQPSVSCDQTSVNDGDKVVWTFKVDALDNSK